MKLTPELEVFLDHVNGAPDSEIEEFLKFNKRVLTKFFSKHYRKLDYDLLVSTFKSNDPWVINETRDFIGQCLDCHLEKIPAQNIKFPTHLERKIARKYGEGLWSKVQESGRNLRDKKIARLLFKDIADIYALATSKRGMTKGERQALLANIVALTAKPLIPGILGSFMGASAAIQGANAALPPSAEVPPDIEKHQVFKAPKNIASIIAFAPEPSIKNAVHDAFNAFNTEAKTTYYNPFLVKKLQTNPETHKYMEWITQAAVKNNLNPVWFANQIYKESDSFSKDVIYGERLSSAGAVGIAQIMPHSLKKVGLRSVEDLKNPRKAIFAAAKYMKRLTDKYGDQIVAAAAYNGGDGSVKYALNEKNISSITGEQLISFYEQKREIHGPGDITKWRNQTFGYMRFINGDGWKDGHMRWAAEQQQNGLPSHMAFLTPLMKPTTQKVSFNNVNPASPTPGSGS